jgi:Domain of unknown function (DUF1338)
LQQRTGPHKLTGQLCSFPHRGGIEEVTRQVEAAGFRLNTSGGQVKVSTMPLLCCWRAVAHARSSADHASHLRQRTMALNRLQVSPDGGLLQSSTMADTHVFRFAGGAQLLTCKL